MMAVLLLSKTFESLSITHFKNKTWEVNLHTSGILIHECSTIKPLEFVFFEFIHFSSFKIRNSETTFVDEGSENIQK